MTVFQTFYVSRATNPLDSAAIQALLQSSRRGNESLQITGCLLFSGRGFAQVLEGERAVMKPWRGASPPTDATATCAS